MLLILPKLELAFSAFDGVLVDGGEWSLPLSLGPDDAVDGSFSFIESSSSSTFGKRRLDLVNVFALVLPSVGNRWCLFPFGELDACDDSDHGGGLTIVAGSLS